VHELLICTFEVHHVLPYEGDLFFLDSLKHISHSTRGIDLSFEFLDAFVSFVVLLLPMVEILLLDLFELLEVL